MDTGRNLDAVALRAGFALCRATEANYRALAKRAARKFRFKVGDAVECKYGADDGTTGWARGRVIKHLYEEPCWKEQPGFLAPYQVRLDDGRLIYAPEDHDSLIRRATCRRVGHARVCSRRRRVAKFA